MHERQRQEAVLQFLGEHRMATVGALAGHLGVSVATVRRDITRMAGQRLIERIPGGAKRLDAAGGRHAGRLTDPSDPAFAAKRAIGELAATLCADGESVMISSGSTTDHLVEALERRRLQVFTNSIAAAAFLVGRTDNQVVVAGGEAYRPRGLLLDLDDDGPRRYHASKLFLGALGVTGRGITESDSQVVRAERRLIDCVDEVVLLADSAKFAPRGNLIICPLRRIGTVVTDDRVPPETVAMLEAAGCRVRIAPVEAPGVRAGMHADAARQWPSNRERRHA